MKYCLSFVCIDEMFCKDIYLQVRCTKIIVCFDVLLRCHKNVAAFIAYNSISLLIYTIVCIVVLSCKNVFINSMTHNYNSMLISSKKQIRIITWYNNRKCKNCCGGEIIIYIALTL